jgi:hypothetical protein
MLNRHTVVDFFITVIRVHLRHCTNMSSCYSTQRNHTGKEAHQRDMSEHSYLQTNKSRIEIIESLNYDLNRESLKLQRSLAGI